MKIIFSFSIICQCIAVIIHETKMLNTFPMQERSHLDTAITFMGAFFGMQNCSKAKYRRFRNLRSKLFSRWWPAGLVGWQQRGSLVLRSLS